MQKFSRFASFLSDVSQFCPDNMYVCFQVMDSDREQNRERRTKQKLDHAGQSGSPQGGHRNFKRTAQRVITVHLTGLLMMEMMDIGHLNMP